MVTLDIPYVGSIEPAIGWQRDKKSGLGRPLVIYI